MNDCSMAGAAFRADGVGAAAFLAENVSFNSSSGSSLFEMERITDFTFRDINVNHCETFICFKVTDSVTVFGERLKARFGFVQSSFFKIESQDTQEVILEDVIMFRVIPASDYQVFSLFDFRIGGPVRISDLTVDYRTVINSYSLLNVIHCTSQLEISRSNFQGLTVPFLLSCPSLLMHSCSIQVTATTLFNFQGSTRGNVTFISTEIRGMFETVFDLSQVSLSSVTIQHMHCFTSTFNYFIDAQGVDNLISLSDITFDSIFSIQPTSSVTFARITGTTNFNFVVDNFTAIDSNSEYILIPEVFNSTSYFKWLYFLALIQLQRSECQTY